MLGKLFSFTCVSTVAFLAYCALTASTLYYLLNPHALIDPEERSTLKPLWPRGTELSVAAYVSTSRRFSSGNSMLVWESNPTRFDGTSIRASPPGKDLNFTRENLPKKFWDKLEDNAGLYIHYRVARAGKTQKKGHNRGGDNEIWLTSSLVKWLDYVGT